jgi:SAM-dependent methyltransferase
MRADHVTVNRDLWNREAPDWAETGARLWAAPTPEWGSWGNPEAELKILPEKMHGLRALELGCGTGYVAGWMARRGAQVTALDISTEQLATARRLAAEAGAEITFLEANAEATGLPGGAFDFAISEYGAAIWCPPALWLAEAHRLLRPGGRLTFLGNHPISLICAPLDGAPADRYLHRPYRAMWGADWTEVPIEPSGICFNLTQADWMALFAEIGFRILRYQELYAPPGVEGTRGCVPADWARDYPVEQVWHLERAD